jgi:hypothetical protein
MWLSVPIKPQIITSMKLRKFLTIRNGQDSLK